MASKLTKFDFLGEACKTTSANVRCLCTDLTLLINACDEATSYRVEHKLSHAEKYIAMFEKLRHLSEDLEKRIDSKCERLLRIAKSQKSW